MSNPPTAFILDFDSTITTSDTISPLTTAAITYQKAHTGIDLTNTWLTISDTYSQLFSRSLHSYTPSSTDRTTLAEEITYQRHLRNVELPSFKRVSESGIFKGVGKEEWKRFARIAVERGEVGVRRGWSEFVESVKRRGGRWGVVSVNFSGEWVRGVLEVGGGGAETSSGVKDRVGNLDVDVLANHPNEEGILLGPGGGPVMATSDAKLAAMEEMLRKWKEEGVKVDRVVYFGDSGTDLECLTKEGVIGVIISGDGGGRLMDSLKRIGREPVHVSSPDVVQKGESETLYWARDFEEVVESELFGLGEGKKL
ncbi:hypothetical protein VTL71DRAFT_3883 [Oculimacula yallundae]|uniref:Uncharacterized protein n=1 Tax=Oculimacula yallundae TaxID=86028 RepID=A0ABR4C4A7_9HELO